MKGKHKTVHKKLKQSVLWLEGLPNVTKVVIGISESCRHRYPPGHIKCKMDVDGGLKINGYSGNGVTDIYIKISPISERPKIKKMISERFPNKT